jgi:hypothetical protein
MLLTMLFAYSCSSDDERGRYSGEIKYGTPLIDTRGGDTIEYKTAEIGGQLWMAENLNYNDPASGCEPSLEACKNGRSYSWAVAMALDNSCNTKVCRSQIRANHRGVCPVGWHIPSNAEWEGKSDKIFYKIGGFGLVWWSTDESDVYGERDAYIWNMPVGNENIRKYPERKISMRSVRCVKD